MHWLENQIQSLDSLRDSLHAAQSKADPAILPRTPEAEAVGLRGVATAPEERLQARRAFHAGIEALAERICERNGITACVVATDGLLVSRSGVPGNDDALAAAAQWCHDCALNVHESLSLGPTRQMVLVGDDCKLALFFIGEMVVAILAPAETNMSESLSR